MKAICRITGVEMEVADDMVTFFVERGLILPPKAAEKAEEKPVRRTRKTARSAKAKEQ